MRIDPQALVIPLKVTLGGSVGEAEIEMALDTGSTYTLIPWNIAQKLGYDPAVSKERVKLVTASSTEVAPVITVEYMEVLGMERRGVKIACHDLPPSSRVEGLLGLSFLKYFNLELYLKGGELRILDP